MTGELALRYGYRTKPSSLLDSIFMSTVNTAARTLLAVASSANIENPERWKLMDHVKYMFMLMTWMVVWALRVMVDYFPRSIGSSLGSSSRLLPDISSVGSLDLVPYASSSKSYASFSSVSSLALVLYEGSDDLPVQVLGRALCQILSMLNELPATSRKYQFAVAMADSILDGNVRDGREELVEVNRMALGSAFARTSGLLYSSIESSQDGKSPAGAWASRIFNTVLPIGSYVVKSVLGAVFPRLTSGGGALFMSRQMQPRLALIEGEEARDDQLKAEKYAQELMWLTNKMRFCGAVDEALLHWSFASGLASISLAANPRVQGFIVNISAILFGELVRGSVEAARQVKFRLLALWLPFFCYAENGVAYPMLTGYEKAEMERIIDQLISTLPIADQQIILTNWLHDFVNSTSDWPNLQFSYDRWCNTTRNLVA